MINLAIRSAQKDDIYEVQHWLALDSPHGFSLDESVEFGGKVDGWVAIDGEEIVAYASVKEDNSRQARISFIVKPSRRREGIAKTFIPMLLESEHIGSFMRITGASALGDTAAKKVLIAARFREIGYDDNGQILFERR